MSRRIITFVIPALIAVYSYFWYKRKSRKSIESEGDTKSSIDSNISEISSEIIAKEELNSPQIDSTSLVITKVEDCSDLDNIRVEATAESEETPTVESEEEDTETLDHCIECAKNQRVTCKRKKARSPKVRHSKLVRWHSSEESVDSWDSDNISNTPRTNCPLPRREMGQRRKKSSKTKSDQQPSKDSSPVNVSENPQPVKECSCDKKSASPDNTPVSPVKANSPTPGSPGRSQPCLSPTSVTTIDVTESMQILSISNDLTCTHFTPASDKFVNGSGSSYGSASHSPADDMLGSPISDALSEVSSVI